MGEKETIKSETKFMWIPGIRPVKIPQKTPTKIAMIIDNIVNVKNAGNECSPRFLERHRRDFRNDFLSNPDIG